MALRKASINRLKLTLSSTYRLVKIFIKYGLLMMKWIRASDQAKANLIKQYKDKIILSASAGKIKFGTNSLYFYSLGIEYPLFTAWRSL